MIDNQPTHSLIDRDNFVQIALQAKLQRANFLRKNAGIAFVMAGSIGLVCVLTLFLSAANNTNGQSKLETVAQMESQSTKRIVEATAQIEKLATILERTKAVGPNTAHEITQLIRQPSYDCDQVACSAATGAARITSLDHN